MDSDLVARYTRQMVLPAVGTDGQDSLSDSHVIVIGLGGLGCPAALYLATAGVGQLTLIDPDRVSLSNLPRQILYDEAQLGQYKVHAARTRLQALNHHTMINTIAQALDREALQTQLAQADLVLDCTDTFASRDQINRASRHTVPLVSAAAIQWSYQVVLLNTDQYAPCYACLFGQQGMDQPDRCADLGVLGPVVGMAGSLQAGLALRYLLDNTIKPGLLSLFDLHTLSTQTIQFKQDPHCPVCSITSL